MILAAILLAAAGTLIATPQPADAIDVVPSAVAVRSGPFASVGFVGTHLQLERRARERLAAAGIDLSSSGIGAELQAGYAFNDHIALELRLLASELATGRYDVAASFGQVLLELVGRLRAEGRVRPFLAGGIGGSAIVLDGGSLDQEALEAAALSAGGGVDVHVSRHWALAFDYRVSVHDFEPHTLAGPVATVAFDGSGLAHDFGFRWSFSF